MTHVKAENIIDVIYLAFFSGAIGLMLGGIIEHNIGIILTGIPELLVTMIGIRYWPKYTKQRWEYLKTMLMALGVSLPIGITLAVISIIPAKDKLLLISIFTVIQILAFANVIDVRIKFDAVTNEEGKI